MPDLRVTYAGLNLKNPVLAAAAGVTATVDRMRRAEDAGVAAVCVKSLFENPIPRRGDPSPHMRVISGRRGPLAWGALYSYEQASHLDEEQYADLIGRAKAALSIPVIANIDCSTPEAWGRYARLVEQAGADAIEVKSCPHGEHLMSGDELASAVALVKGLVSVPVIAKLPGQLTSPYRAALDIEAAGADALVMFNRFSGLDIDVETEAPVMHGGFAGHGGPWSIYYRLRWIAQVTPELRIPVCGTGGVGCGEDVAKYVLAGATCVQLATAAILEGYGAFGRIIREFGEWMERKGHANVASARGLAAGRLLAIGDVSRRQTVRAAIDADACTACGLCGRVCIYGGVDVPEPPEKETYSVNELCHGCGLCAEVCPARAIALTELSTWTPAGGRGGQRR
ncbi:MAG: 4Fe-4S binding protein [Bacillota bacterium]|nr:4Fe-4S binding protein [Bacillota bacterium]